jgi:hypothetical protein
LLLRAVAPDPDRAVTPELAHAARGLFGQPGIMGPIKVLLLWVPNGGGR